MRGRFQGIRTVIRFNWHFFALSFGLAILLLSVASCLGPFAIWAQIMAGLVLATTTVSLLVTYYVYDLSDLYSLNWIGYPKTPKTIVNVHAGFDETSELIQQKFSTSKLHVFDFYDPKKHTEISIERARKASAPFSGTVPISSNRIPSDDESADLVIVFMSAHEIRDDHERLVFFHELHRIAKADGNVVVVEHLRNWRNFLAYTVGFFHFQSRKTWLETFNEARFCITKELNLTPFVTIFSLSKNGTTS